MRWGAHWPGWGGWECDIVENNSIEITVFVGVMCHIRRRSWRRRRREMGEEELIYLSRASKTNKRGGPNKIRYTITLNKAVYFTYTQTR